MNNEGKVIEILLVEDNPGDARLAMETLKEGRLANRIEWVKDGVEAMQYMHAQGPFTNAKRPDLILLDLNLPRKDGREVLLEIKNDPALRAIPVVVLTISKADEDILGSYKMHANCFITKPIDLNQFIVVVRTIEDFWLTIVKLPAQT
jgi:chemotaxis family two-component system response regulator Rcp1